MLATEFGTGQVFWSILWFTVFFIWIWLLIDVFRDIFRSADLGGFAKFLWTMFVIVTPYIGVFLYLILRGNKMSEHAVADAQARDAAAQAYIRHAVGTGGTGAAAELERLADLRDRGILTPEEFDRQKAQVLGT